MNINVFILPDKENKELLRLLQLEYIKEGFNGFLRAVSRTVRCDHTSNPETAQQLMLLVNNLFLYNVYKYLNTQNQLHFFNSMANNTFAHELCVENHYFRDLMRSLIGNNVANEDMDEMENQFSQVLLNYMSHFYSQSSGAYNEVFCKLFCMFQEQVPYQVVTPYRFEQTPYLAPMLMYSNKEAVYA